jgi:hypothetical protein
MLSEDELVSIYESRPFKTRNADEYDISDVLDLFVDPTDGLRSPFDFENSIIKGRMGTGKTMYLRANYAYYLYTVIPSLLDGDTAIFPIYIRLSDFNTLSSPLDIYKNIIIKIIKEMIATHSNFIESENLARLHAGIKILASEAPFSSSSLKQVVLELSKNTCEEYIERTTQLIKGQANLKSSFMDLSLECGREFELQLRKKGDIGIHDLIWAYEMLLKPFNGRILLLFDEAGSLNKSFFNEQEGISIFEQLMNQLRTLDYIRTKFAVYPQSYSDILEETRYGDAILLQENVKDEKGYIGFANRTISLIEKYIKEFTEIPCKIEDLFSISKEQMEIIEQIIHASDGNARRLVHLLDLTLGKSYQINNGTEKVNISHVYAAIRDNARSLERTFSQSEIEFLNSLATICRARNTYRFKFPYKSIDLHRYINKSSEYNILNLVEPGSGRKGAIYEFDYSYAVYKEIPTHYIKGTERIDKIRSRVTGEWINKITSINETIFVHANILKIQGEISYISSNGDGGYIKNEEGIEYVFLNKMIVDFDKKKKYYVGQRVRFLPYTDDGISFAYYIEIL